MADLTLSNIKARKALVEQKINEILKDFEVMTELPITAIEIDRITFNESGQAKENCIQIRVTCKVKI